MRRVIDREEQAAAAAANKARAQAAREADAVAAKQKVEAERAATREQAARERRAAEVLTPTLPVGRTPSVAVTTRASAPAPVAVAGKLAASKAPAAVTVKPAVKAVSIPAAAPSRNDGANDWDTLLALPLLVIFWTVTYDRLLNEEED
jgi:L-fucose isomerase-like protein